MSEKKSLDEGEIASRPVTRRSAIGLLSAAAVGLSLEGCYRGLRGCSDSDPVDPAGAGRRCGGWGSLSSMYCGPKIAVRGLRAPNLG